MEAIRPGYPVDNYPTFTNSTVAMRTGFNTLRFMDWAATNGNEIENWADRNTLDAIQYDSKTP